jgi:hypothetical protein
VTERRERYLDAQRRYNLSAKGRTRYRRYEDAHPERKGTRWEPARNALNHAARPAA